MKLPQLKGAPVQRLTTPDPATAAAPMQALGSIGEMVGGKVDEYLAEKEKRSSAADYTNRLGDIESADIDVRQRIEENPYTRVSSLPKGVEPPQGTIENRYDPGTDSIEEFVATDEVSGDLYTAFMGDFIKTQMESSRNEAVATRLQGASHDIVNKARLDLFKSHVEKSRARDTAKYTLELERAIENENEDRANEIITRASFTLGINIDEAMGKAHAKLDEQYFINGSQRATTTTEVEQLKDQLANDNWRFDGDVKKSTYTMLIRREQNLDSVESQELKGRQNDAFVNAMSVIATDGMTVDQINELKWLRPEQYTKLLTAAQTDAKTFKTPETTRLWVDRQIQAVARGDYSIVGTDNFNDAKDALRDTLEGLLGTPDPFNDSNYTQKMSSADYANYSQQILGLDQIGYENKQVSVGKSQIYLMVTGASEEAFNFDPDKDAQRQIALNDALGDYYQYIEQAGPEAEPMEWVEKNLYKYTAGPAKEAIMGLSVEYKDLRGTVIWNAGGSKVKFQETLDRYKQELANTMAQDPPNKTGAETARKSIAQLEQYKKAYPLNVE